MNSFLRTIKEELSSLVFLQPNFIITPMDGGALNSSYRLQSGSTCYFLKTFESDSIAKLDRQALFLLQEELFANHLAIEPVYLSGRHLFQVDQWVEDKTLNKAKLSKTVIIEQLAKALVRIHKVKVTHAYPLDLPAQWAHYISILEPRVEPADLILLQEYTDIWRYACSEEVVFCHNDLALSHVTASQTPKVFDWEYSALSNPYFDLASCVVINQIGHKEAVHLCAVYSELMGKHGEDVWQKIKGMLPLVEFTNRLWFAAAKTID
ncbi:phosphotransferase [Paraglaciecola sp. 2405UD69-4]|uniref:phosphotransferase n=1 Tax=Paraglaciecola sp. 2405UD69-4 TaxID=3391836 RepID=UPI0039C8E8D8